MIVGIVLAGKDVTGAAHVGGKLVNFIEASVDDLAAKGRVAKIRDDKVVRFGLVKLRIFEIHAADPKALALKPLDQVMADKPSGTTY